MRSRFSRAGLDGLDTACANIASNVQPNSQYVLGVATTELIGNLLEIAKAGGGSSSGVGNSDEASKQQAWLALTKLSLCAAINPCENTYILGFNGFSTPPITTEVGQFTFSLLRAGFSYGSNFNSLRRSWQMPLSQPIGTLSGHDDRVWSVAWSPQGDMLASCSGDKTVRIWSRRQPRPPATMDEDPGQQPQPQLQPQLQPQPQWYCSAILDQCHTRTIRSVAWSPTGRALATASFDATVAVWELSGGVWEQVAELEGHENEVKCVAWNPDGRLIATCGRDRSVWIWESMPGREFECVDVKQGHSQDVKVVTWHPSGELLVSAGYDDTIKLWTYDGDEWGCAQTLGGTGTGHESTVWDVCWDPVSRARLASCSDDLTLRLWESRAAPTSTPAPAPASGSGAVPDGAAGGAGPAAGAAHGFVPSKPDLRCAVTLSGHHRRTPFSLDWAPTGLLATGDGDDSICVFGEGDPDMAQLLLRRQQQQQQQQPAAVAAVAGAAAAAAAVDPAAAPTADGDAAMSDAPGAAAAGLGAGQGQGQGQGHGEGREEGAGLLTQPGGQWGCWARVAKAHAADVNCVRWNPAEPRLLASCSDDGLIRLWWLR
ncbi:hypothetical protein HXX76_015932 [Chlamydomonas incerta]|uniref:Probable cytosolic iron-sulfur protein assembly protein CIAO1 homolog n=1 Tax=Chlamydomonas incerta TaxID=51695 RepID=A0A835SD75_CHLIN|nr:hypothetical protein HXX76_015932 [Chlamydomonas incerta]|eukprot:KAG2422552.1 hypothetical protein HXX76_015932 [Chlamydomonas incerta]